MTTLRECPHPTCRVKIESRYLACSPHWYQLSAATRARVRATSGQPLLSPVRRVVLEAAMKEWRSRL